MRFVNTLLLSLVLAVFAASTAGAWEIRMSPRDYTEGQTVSPGDTVIIDVFFDTDPAPSGLQNFSIGVVFDDTGQLQYNGTASQDLPIIYPAPPGSDGNQPAYVLYNPGKPAQILYPTQTPHALWNGTNKPGKIQVNLDFADPGLVQNQLGGVNIWVASLVFDVVEEGDGSTVIELSPFEISQGNLIFADNDPFAGVTATIGGDTPLTVTVPEPAIASLALASVSTVGFLYLRRRKSQIS
jgi:hypothetical protein